jgi:hypothetical protein
MRFDKEDKGAIALDEFSAGVRPFLTGVNA